MSNYRKYQNRRSNTDDDIVTALAIAGLFIFYKYWPYILSIIILIVIYKIIVFIIDRDLFSTFKESKLYYQGNSGEKYLHQLEQQQLKGKDNQYQINCLKKGLYGENKILYTLTHIEDLPMYIMHDVYLECNNQKAQIDCILVTKKMIYIIEIKDLSGNLDIETDGTFTRKFGNKKRGMKNPLTQNKDHEKVIKAIMKKEKIRGPFQSIVVLANNDSYIHFKRGSNEYKTKIFRNDKLEENLLILEKKHHIIRQEEKIKQICDTILKYQCNDQQNYLTIVDRLKMYRKKMAQIEKVPTYIILHDNTILELATKQPTTTNELLNITGLGEYKIQKYGNDIIEIIKESL